MNSVKHFEKIFSFDFFEADGNDFLSNFLGAIAFRKTGTQRTIANKYNGNGIKTADTTGGAKSKLTVELRTVQPTENNIFHIRTNLLPLIHGNKFNSILSDN